MDERIKRIQELLAEVAHDLMPKENWQFAHSFGQQTKNGPQAQRLMASVTCRWCSARARA